jgi:transcriptional regulator with XRE-family HTH domain
VSIHNPLGKLLRSRRKALALSQRAVAAKLGVQPSYVAFMEGGRRRPSLALIERLAKTLGFDRQELFVLIHPEAKAIVEPAPTAKTRDAAQSWQALIEDKALLARYEISALELKALRQLNLLGYALTQREFLMIVTVIRGTEAGRAV